MVERLKAESRLAHIVHVQFAVESTIELRVWAAGGPVQR
jgi:hypothetical protein